MAVPLQDAADGSKDRGHEALWDPHVLTMLFRLLSLEDRLKTVPLVCKAWRDVQRSPGCHWSDLTLEGWRVQGATPQSTQQSWDRLLAWLAPRCRCLHRLALPSFRQWAPAAPTSLHSIRPSSQSLAALLSLLAPSLHELVVERSSPSLIHPTSVCALSQLVHLRSCHMYLVGPLPSRHLDALGTLTHLRELSVCLVRTSQGTSAFDGPFPSQLTRLRRLRSLRLEGPYSGRLSGRQYVLPNSIAEWQELECLSLLNLGLAALPPAIGQLPALRELCLGRNMLGAEDPSGSLPEEMTLLHSLTRLELQYNHFDAGLPAVLGELRGLVELNVSGNMFGATASDLPLGRLSALRYLTLTNCQLSHLPEGVRACSSLQLLKLNINRLAELPEGPWLSRNLKFVDMAHNPLPQYPPVLYRRRCPSLESISFIHSGRHFSVPAAAEAFCSAAAAGEGAEAAGSGPAGMELVVAPALPLAAVAAAPGGPVAAA